MGQNGRTIDFLERLLQRDVADAATESGMTAEDLKQLLEYVQAAQLVAGHRGELATVAISPETLEIVRQVTLPIVEALNDLAGECSELIERARALEIEQAVLLGALANRLGVRDGEPLDKRPIRVVDPLSLFGDL